MSMTEQQDQNATRKAPPMSEEEYKIEIKAVPRSALHAAMFEAAETIAAGQAVFVDTTGLAHPQAAIAGGQSLAGIGAAERAARWVAEKIDERTTQRFHLVLLGFSEEQADRFLAITWAAEVDPLPAARYLIQDQGDPSTWKW